MKLLFDHNLSPRLIQRLADIYPDTEHTSHVGLDRAPDLIVWTYAQTNNYIIVTKDSDFSDISVLRGSPPKVIWLRLGNCTTTDIENSLRGNYTTIDIFAHDDTSSVLELS